jgi:hypothetical protein
MSRSTAGKYALAARQDRDRDGDGRWTDRATGRRRHEQCDEGCFGRLGFVRREAQPTMIDESSQVVNMGTQVEPSRVRSQSPSNPGRLTSVKRASPGPLRSVAPSMRAAPTERRRARRTRRELGRDQVTMRHAAPNIAFRRAAEDESPSTRPRPTAMAVTASCIHTRTDSARPAWIVSAALQGTSRARPGL